MIGLYDTVLRAVWCVVCCMLFGVCIVVEVWCDRSQTLIPLNGALSVNFKFKLLVPLRKLMRQPSNHINLTLKIHSMEFVTLD